MIKNLEAELNQEIITPFHSLLLQKVKSLVEMSRGQMSEYYSQWDYHDLAYRGERRIDKEDAQALQRGEVSKMAIPLTFAQVQVFVAFLFSQYFQRPSFYQLDPTGQEDYDAAKIGEAFLTRDLNYNQFSVKLYQWLTDLGKYGIAIFKHGWFEETTTVYKKVEQPGLQLLGFTLKQPKTITQKEQAVSFQGNKLFNISPYRFFPDTRLPISRCNEGEFIASEDEYAVIALEDLECNGEVYGVKWIPTFSKSSWDKRKTYFAGLNPEGNDKGTVLAKDVKSTVCVTEVQIKLIPSKWELADNSKLGDETFPVMYNVWYANDARIIKAEPMGYEHGKFTYDVSQFAPDQHRLCNDGICGLVAHLQDVINWLMNTRITNVRKVISNFLVVDPSRIDIADIVNKKTVIKTKPGMGAKGIDTAIKQLQVADVTQSHIQDIQVLQGLIGLVSGVSESALGQFATGRRSASEAKNVYSATLGRLQMIARIVWDSGLAPMGMKMLSNLRAGVTEDTYVRTMGDLANMQSFNGFVKVNGDALIGNFDLEMYDGTLASDRSDMAATLENVLTALIGNPEGIPLFNLNPNAILREIASLKGIKHMNRFNIVPLPGEPVSPNDPGQQDITPLLQRLAAQGGLVGQQQPGAGGPAGAPPQPGPLGGAVPQAGAGGSNILSMLAQGEAAS